MATPASIRPSISWLAAAKRSFPSINATPATVAPISSSQKCCFSSTPECNNRRPRRDNNRLRGLSSLYRSGTRFRMNIDKSELPQPAKFKPKIKVNPNHGLWDFFYERNKLLLTPDESSEHGRGWTVEELRHKSWEDLHKLWWVCIKEQNRIATARNERGRLGATDGDDESDERMFEVRRTMRSIKHALTERWYLWEDARKLAETDPEVDLSNTETPFTPQSYLEEVENPDEGQISGQAPSGFMSEQPEVTRSEAVEPSTLPPDTSESRQPPIKP
ncbi:mitochondrial 39-S ribosomal protein L47 (MRP-L47)-domain-containing protein [Nemania sp. FL0916]|nr:mitochondrial 39-S ribosomal protein L47 (MRP-L47)-domain-containing protein [Nemania sp. FL0916]